MILRNQRTAGRGQAWARAGTQWTMTWSAPLAVVEGERESLPTLRRAFHDYCDQRNDYFDTWICLDYVNDDDHGHPDHKRKGEFSTLTVSISIRMSVVNGHPEHKNDCFDSWFNQLICLWLLIMSMWMIMVILIIVMTILTGNLFKGVVVLNNGRILVCDSNNQCVQVIIIAVDYVICVDICVKDCQWA